MKYFAIFVLLLTGCTTPRSAEEELLEQSLATARAFVWEAENTPPSPYYLKHRYTQHLVPPPLRSAAVAYKSLIVLNDARNPVHAVYIRQAYLEYIPLLVTIGRFAEVRQRCDEFVQIFPGDSKIETIEHWKKKYPRLSSPKP